MERNRKFCDRDGKKFKKLNERIVLIEDDDKEFLQFFVEKDLKRVLLRKKRRS